MRIDLKKNSICFRFFCVLWEVVLQVLNNLKKASKGEGGPLICMKDGKKTCKVTQELIFLHQGFVPLLRDFQHNYCTIEWSDF